MIVEGKGRQPPAPWILRLTTHDLRCILDMATERADFRKYRFSTNPWKRGLSNSLSIPGVASNIRGDVVPYVIGIAGEYGVAQSLGSSVDSSLRPCGDNGDDVAIGRTRMQVKTRRSDSSHAGDRLNLVRCTDSRGICKRPSAPLLVFCELDVMEWRLAMLGWLRTSFLSRFPLVPARRGQHKNVEVPDAYLETMNGIKEMIQCR